MGKNAGHKARQAQRYTTTGAEEEEQPARPGGAIDGMVDVSYHTPEWHAARIAALTVGRMSWEEWKQKQKDMSEKEGMDEQLMREYRAQLDADRARRMGVGAAGPSARAADEKASKKRRKDKKHKKEKSKKEKSRKEKSKKSKKEKSSKKRRRSRSSDSSSDSGSSSDSSGSSSGDSRQLGGSAKRAKAAAADGPIKLSEYLKD